MSTLRTSYLYPWGTTSWQIGSVPSGWFLGKYSLCKSLQYYTNLAVMVSFNSGDAASACKISKLCCAFLKAAKGFKLNTAFVRPFSLLGWHFPGRLEWSLSLLQPALTLVGYRWKLYWVRLLVLSLQWACLYDRCPEVKNFLYALQCTSRGSLLAQLWNFTCIKAMGWLDIFAL